MAQNTIECQTLHYLH